MFEMVFSKTYKMVSITMQVIALFNFFLYQSFFGSSIVEQYIYQCPIRFNFKRDFPPYPLPLFV